MPTIDVLFDQTTIDQRLTELGKEISAHYQNTTLCMVGVLKGSFIFMADLARKINLPLTCEFIAISSYGNDTESSGVVQITSDLTQNIENKDVLIVEDIIDTGYSAHYLLANFQTRKPKSLRVCSLLDKPDNRKVNVTPDFVGFSISNHFVVGYGLDVAGQYRNLPYIGVYRG